MNNLKALRAAAGYKQDQVADFLNITRAAYSNIENGKRLLDQEKLVALSTFYNVSTDYILGKTEQKSAPAAEAAETPSDDDFIARMKNLSPLDRQRVESFVAGLEAAHTLPADHQD